MPHVACNSVGSFCIMLSRVGQMNARLCNMVAKRTQHVAYNCSFARCCTNMLHPFGQGFRLDLMTDLPFVLLRGLNKAL